jgi:hypothetical protein
VAPAVLRAVTASGVVWDDPSEDLLFELLSDIERGEEQFVIVERTLDESGQTFAQSMIQKDGTFVVEHRAGGPSAHFRLRALAMGDAHAALTAWAFELPGWETVYGWQPVQL